MSDAIIGIWVVRARPGCLPGSQTCERILVGCNDGRLENVETT